MNEQEILSKVKNLLGMGENTSNDNILMGFIAIVKQDMIDSGVHTSIVNSESAIGTIERGVLDNWKYGEGASYSQMYIDGVVKLRAKNPIPVASGENNEL